MHSRPPSCLPTGRDRDTPIGGMIWIFLAAVVRTIFAFEFFHITKWMIFFFFYSKHHQAFSSWYVCILWLSITKSVNIFSNKYKWNVVPIWNAKLMVRCFSGWAKYDTRLNANILIMVLHFSEQFYIKTTVLWAVFNDVILITPQKVPYIYLNDWKTCAMLKNHQREKQLKAQMKLFLTNVSLPWLAVIIFSVVLI